MYQAGGGLGSIRLLRLCSHGSAGNLFFGTGMHIYDIPKWEPPWTKLRDYMRRDGKGVELFACGVASETAIVTWDHVDNRGEYRPGTFLSTHYTGETRVLLQCETACHSHRWRDSAAATAWSTGLHSGRPRVSRGASGSLINRSPFRAFQGPGRGCPGTHPCPAIDSFHRTPRNGSLGSRDGIQRDVSHWTRPPRPCEYQRTAQPPL